MRCSLKLEGIGYRMMLLRGSMLIPYSYLHSWCVATWGRIFGATMFSTICVLVRGYFCFLKELSFVVVSMVMTMEQLFQLMLCYWWWFFYFYWKLRLLRMEIMLFFLWERGRVFGFHCYCRALLYVSPHTMWMVIFVDQDTTYVQGE